MLSKKRTTQIPFRLNDSEVIELEALQARYQAAGLDVSRSFLLRYSFKRLIALPVPSSIQ